MSEGPTGTGTAPAPAEADRLAALRSYGVLDTAPERAFGEIVEVAARMLRVPMAAVSLVDEHRQWFKAQVGLPASETDRDVSFCAHAILEPDKTFVVEDAAADERFAGNSLVTGAQHIRAYAGVPLIGVDDQPLGALCVIDSQPRRFTAEELAELERLARQVEALLELRRIALSWQTRAADDRFSVAFRQAPLPMNLVGPDGRFLQVNDAMATLCQRSVEELVGKPVGLVIGGDDHIAERLVMQRLIDGEIESAVRSGYINAEDGSETAVLATTSAIRSQTGELLFFLTSLEDVAQQLRAEDALALTHTALEAIIAIDATGNVVFWNTGASTMFGHRPSEVLGRSVALIIPERLRGAHHAGVNRLASGASPGLVDQAVQLTGLRASGEEFPIELVLTRWSTRDETHYTAMIRDVTERQQLLEELDRRANVDELTGLASRARFTSEVAAAAQQGRPATVALVGLDRFRRINESLGYRVGDDVLRQVADRMAAALPVDDVLLARTGGDQFGILVNGDRAWARGLIEDVRCVVEQPLTADGRNLNVSASAGLADVRSDQPPRTAIREAETAMHRAKSATPPPGIAVYDDNVRVAALARLGLEHDLRKAVQDGDLELHYQPEFELRTGRRCAYEALLRWERPGYGPVSPAEFVPLAEETGLIHALGEWVLDRALADLAAQQRRLGVGAGDIAVNLSAVQLNDPGLPRRIADAVDRHCVDARDVVVELTETAIMSDSASEERLHQIADLGVRIAIDDFGTGYSSLARLQALPVSILKIDKCFVDPLPGSGSELIAAIVALASSLRLATVAEGIENQLQAAALAALGVDLGQGFHLGRPAPQQPG